MSATRPQLPPAFNRPEQSPKNHRRNGSGRGSREKKPIKAARLNRKIHYWGAIISALPVLIIIGSGIVLMFKKDVAWIQPPTAQAEGGEPSIGFARILEAASSVPEAGITSWDDIDRLDVRPGKGIIKVRAENRWEIQIDHQSGEVLQVAYRRSDLIESIHDGSFFHDSVKMWIFLPSALILFVLWVTGIYLFFQPMLARRSRLLRQGGKRAIS